MFQQCNEVHEGRLFVQLEARGRWSIRVVTLYSGM